MKNIYNTKTKKYLTSIGLGLNKGLFTEENWSQVMGRQCWKSDKARKNLKLEVYDITPMEDIDISLFNLNTQNLDLIEKKLKIKEILD